MSKSKRVDDARASAPGRVAFTETTDRRPGETVNVYVCLLFERLKFVSRMHYAGRASVTVDASKPNRIVLVSLSRCALAL